MCPKFQQTFVYILYAKLKELCQLKFVYKMHTKVCQNVGYILYTSCIHFVYLNSDPQKVCIIRTMYTTCIQISHKMYTNNCIKSIPQPIGCAFHR